MKWVVWILLLLNLLAVGIFIGKDYWPQPASDRKAPLNVDRLGLRKQPAQSEQIAQAAPAPKEEPQQAVAAETMCVEWRGLNPEEFARVREQLKALVGESAMSFTEVPLSTRHWVFFPPLPSARSAAAKLAELTAAGVQDTFVVKNGAFSNAISLGLYANDVAAGRRLSELESKGVLGTRVELLPRQGTGFYFVIRSEDPEALKSLSGIKQAYPNSQQSRVACSS